MHGFKELYCFVHKKSAKSLAKRGFTDAIRSPRGWPSATTLELEHGVPLFLTQLSETLKREMTTTPFSSDAINASAVQHGRELQALGFNVSEVVHDYGDICQAVTELALDQGAAMTVAEFHSLNRCLDTAIAEAVTQHARMTAKRRTTEETEAIGVGD
jgi:hypothetical protein